MTTYQHVRVWIGGLDETTDETEARAELERHLTGAALTFAQDESLRDFFHDRMADLASAKEDAEKAAEEQE